MKKFVFLVFLLFCSCNEEQQEVDCSGVAGGDAICGCTDSTAVNFSPIATYDDGSCVFEIVKLTFESTGPINAHFDITKELPRFRCTVFSYADETVNIDSVWSHIVEGDFGNQDEDAFYLLNYIFNNVINISDLIDSLSNNTEIRITVLLNNNDQQLHEDFYPSEELLAILYFIQNNVSEWCPVGYLKIDNICYHPGDMMILQELVGNFAPGVLVTMEEPVWEEGRLVYFHCIGCPLQETLPDSLGNLTELRELIIENTLLTGGMPESLFDLEHLEVLILSDNHLSGAIPESICNFDVNNMAIDLSQNQFCPPYPGCILDYIGEQACDE